MRSAYLCNIKHHEVCFKVFPTDQKFYNFIVIAVKAYLNFEIRLIDLRIVEDFILKSTKFLFNLNLFVVNKNIFKVLVVLIFLAVTLFFDVYSLIFFDLSLRYLIRLTGLICIVIHSVVPLVNYN